MSVYKLITGLGSTVVGGLGSMLPGTITTSGSTQLIKPGIQSSDDYFIESLVVQMEFLVKHKGDERIKKSLIQLRLAMDEASKDEKLKKEVKEWLK